MKDSKLYSALRFYLLATKLKDKIRSGWNNTHWNVQKERLESVPEHVFGTCILALGIKSQGNYDINLDRVLKMLVVHELGEAIIGDITPFDGISPEEKQKREHEAFAEVVGDLEDKDEILTLIIEFDEKKTKEAIFAYHCDKLEADLQSKIYQDTGYHKDLNSQQNNVVFQNEKVKSIVENGAKTAFDVWYECDKTIYKDENFIAMLEIVKNIDLTQEDLL